MDTLPASTDWTPTLVHGGEEAPKEQHVTTINSKCTEIGKHFKGKPCARIVPVTVTYQGKAISLYAMLDDQSNKTLSSKEGIARVT